MKKIVSFLLCCLLAFSLVGCKGSEKGPEEVTVAVAIATMTDEYVRMQDYFNNYLGPALNVKFIFSSEIKSVEEYMTFIENAVTAGATGLVDLAGSKDTAEAIDAKCKEFNIPFSTWTTANFKALQNPSGLLAGGVGSDATQLENAAHDWAKKIFTGEGELNLVICSIIAYLNNTMHVPATTGYLKAISENYNLGLTDDEIHDLVFSDTNRKWSKGNVNLLFVPGLPGSNYGDTDAAAPMVEAGKYDTIILSGDSYPKFFQTLDRWEETMNRDFQVYTLGVVSDAIYNGFNEKDIAGNPKLQSVLMKTGTAGIFGLAILLNEMYGNDEVLGDHGVFPLSFSPLTGAAEYESAKLIDTAEAYYTITVDEFKSMLKVYNSDLTFDGLYEKVSTYSQIASAIERRQIGK